MTSAARNKLYTAQIIAGTALAAAAYTFAPKPSLRGKVVFITGSSRGLGFALAQQFASRGAKVVLTARKPNELAKAKQSLIDTLHIPASAILTLTVDLTSQAQAAGAIEAAQTHFGRIDILVNNAGIIEVGPVEDQPLAAYERAIQTNFFGALYCIQAVLPAMLADARYAGTRPSIVNIASVGGKVAVPHMLPYTASKFALVGLSQGLHAELRQKGIRVTTVCPGLMRSGGEEHAIFVGKVEKERRLFMLGAKTPLVAASVTGAARKIVDAVATGRTEITITPQAWLAARIAGLAPETTQTLASLANEFILPAAQDPTMTAANALAAPSPSHRG